MSMPTEVVTESVNTTAVNINPVNTNTNNNNNNESNNKSDKPTTAQKTKDYNRLTRILRKPKSAVKPHPWRREKTCQKAANQSNNTRTSISANIDTGLQASEELSNCKQEQERISHHNNNEEEEIGFSLNRMRELIHSLTPAERERAMAGLDPLSQTQEALAQRAARFGLPLHNAKPQAEEVAVANDNNNNNNNVNVANDSKRARVEVVCTPLDMSDETLQKREARFKTAEQVEMETQLQRRAARFGISTAANVDHSNTITSTQVAPGIDGGDVGHNKTTSSFAGNTQTSAIKLSDADRAAMEARAKRFGMEERYISKEENESKSK